MNKTDNGNGILRHLPPQIALKEPNSFMAEQYRILYTRLLQMRKNRTLQVVGITSAVQGEGKSTVAFNLAITMARSYHTKTLLIEADTKNPTFASMITTSKGGGLTDALAGRTDLSSLLQYTLEGRLAVLPIGSITEETTVLFTQERLQEVVEKVRGEFDFILLDAPPVLPLADMNILSDVVDGLLFVVQADRTPRSLVNRALSMLPAPKLLGLVFNNLKRISSYSSYYRYYYTKREVK